MVCFSWAPEWNVDQADDPVSENILPIENILTLPFIIIFYK